MQIFLEDLQVRLARLEMRYQHLTTLPPHYLATLPPYLIDFYDLPHEPPSHLTTSPTNAITTLPPYPVTTFPRYHFTASTPTSHHTT